jgi:hypothetical protein
MARCSGRCQTLGGPAELEVRTPMDEQTVTNAFQIQAGEPSNGRNRRRRIITVVLGIVLAVISCYLGGAIGILAGIDYESRRIPESLVVINQDDPFVVERAKQFNLPQVIQQYDQVINAIESYHQDHGVYPPELSALVPDYLPRVPGIYIRRGERLTYAPEPEQEGAAPFTFYIYGHYPGLAFMHGWELEYCPKELDLCNETNDRHYHPHRINDRWIWISRSAL